VSPVEVIAAIRTRLDAIEMDEPARWEVTPSPDPEDLFVLVTHVGWLDHSLMAQVPRWLHEHAVFIAAAPEDVARLLAVAEAAVRSVVAERAHAEALRTRSIDNETEPYVLWLHRIYNPACDELEAARAGLVAAVAGLGDGVPEP
jgi:hypothetical protein